MLTAIAVLSSIYATSSNAQDRVRELVNPIIIENGGLLSISDIPPVETGELQINGTSESWKVLSGPVILLPISYGVARIFNYPKTNESLTKLGIQFRIEHVVRTGPMSSLTTYINGYIKQP